MKKYNAPEMELVKYDKTEVLTDSQGNVTKNGKYNLEIAYQEWNDDII